MADFFSSYLRDTAYECCSIIYMPFYTFSVVRVTATKKVAEQAGNQFLFYYVVMLKFLIITAFI